MPLGAFPRAREAAAHDRSAHDLGQSYPPRSAVAGGGDAGIHAPQPDRAAELADAGRNAPNPFHVAMFC
jgi:hypothetical protein